jgi:signal transduction histidine kinase
LTVRGFTLMTLPSDSYTLMPEASRTHVDHSSLQVREGETNLVFTLDATGHYQSFYWQDADRYGLLATNHMVGRSIDDPTTSRLTPVKPDVYLERLQHVLDHLLADQFSYPFCCGDRYLVFDFTLSPILTPQGQASAVVAIANHMRECDRQQAHQILETLTTPTLMSGTSPYQKPLNQVAWNIRRSLDLEAIWQKTVDGLGKALGLSRCLICPYTATNRQLQVAAEYRQLGVASMLQHTIDLDNEPVLAQALATREAVMVTTAETPLDKEACTMLAIATTYQDQANGILLLYQFDPTRVWNRLEIDLIQELADQVGTGIAHATLFTNSCNLTGELQKANESLMRQHEELEEARRQAEEASRLKSEFLANTSHELRTPLNGMIGFLKLIMDGMADDPEEQQEFIDEAYRSAVHLLSIINDILDIAKIEAGKMQLELDPVRLDDLLNDVDNFTRTQAEQKNLSFEILTPATRDDVILKGNYQRLLQVMLNLVGNAIKFTHEGGITISAEILPKKSALQGEEEPGFARISVADTGIGVSLEKQDKLFQSFSQVDGSRTRQYGGTGLGLAISQKLIEAMGGVVNFYSMGEGLGATVTFTVPLYQDPVMIPSPEDGADLLA